MSARPLHTLRRWIRDGVVIDDTSEPGFLRSGDEKIPLDCDTEYVEKRGNGSNKYKMSDIWFYWKGCGRGGAGALSVSDYSSACQSQGYRFVIFQDQKEIQ